MNKLALTIICLLSSFVHANAATQVSGQIRSNTTWTKAGSPYVLNGTIEIEDGFTLTIEPGVVIECDERIDVYGYLQASGTTADSITFKPKKGKEWWGGLRFYQKKSDTLRFQYCHFENQGQVMLHFDIMHIYISNSYFNNASIVVDNKWGPHGSLIIENSKFMYSHIRAGGVEMFIMKDNFVTASIYAEHTTNARFYRNNINGGTYGIKCHATNAEIVDNIIANTTGIALDIVLSKLDRDIPCSGNIIAHNKHIGLNTNMAWGLVKGNSIYDNKIGVAHSFYPADSQLTYEDNCIYDNDSLNFYNYSGADYHIARNWWGTIDSSVIESTIYDNTDDFKRGRVTFMPILQANTTCQTYTPPAKIFEQEKLIAKIGIYPNPFNESFTVKTTDNTTLQRVFVYNLVGKRIANVSAGNKQQVTIDATSQPPGMYLYVAITSDNQTITGKIVKD